MGSESPIKCEAGFYIPSGVAFIDGSDCIPCPQGYSCLFGQLVSTPDGLAGYFYPNRTRYAEENSCPAGTYTLTTTRASQASDCLSCTAGSYCREGSGVQTTCPSHAYCPAGSFTFKKCPPGFKLTSTGASSLNTCQLCSTTEVCVGGSDPVTCPAGYTSAVYLNANSTLATEILCTQVPAGQYKPTPTSAVLTCPNGQYSQAGAIACYPCPPGYSCTSGLLTPCLSGTYCTTGSFAPLACPAGRYCPSDKLNRTLPCPAGKYCPLGTIVPLTTPATYYTMQGQAGFSGQECGSGYVCLSGGATGPSDQACPANTFAGPGADTCQACDQGFYCPVGSSEQQTCKLGYYCDQLTAFPQKCPKGTYGAAVNLTSASQCTPCPGGYYCPQEGQISQSDMCDPGYYCSGGSWTPQPDPDDIKQSLVGGLCPAGSFCPKASPQPQPCQSGTFNSFPGMRSAEDCIACTAGFYCEGSRSSSPTGQCQAGYYCIGGANSATQHSAQIGHYSISGSANQIACQPGTYQPVAAQSSCLLCEAGKYCNSLSLSAGLDCPAGFYCPIGSINPIPCKMGTYNPQASTSGQNACLNCSAGKYCDETGLTYEKGQCSKGYFCNSGSPSKTPAINLTSQSAFISAYGMCPRGHYCIEGSSIPQPCPIGYYLDSEGGVSATDCIKCQAGKYCANAGLPSPTGSCQASYYCPEGSISATSVQCPIGHYCLLGSPIELSCLAGTYQPQAAQSTCIDCPAGSYCEQGAVNPITCPKGAYCPAKTQLAQSNKCLAGTINDLTGQETDNSCLACPQGLYCRIPGQTTRDEIGVGVILDGYLNEVLRSKSPIPTGGSLCPRGYYCIQGVKYACPAGKYCDNEGLVQAKGDCLQGSYCPGTAKHMSPLSLTSTSDGVLTCNQSHYCNTGSSAPEPCPVGTYSNGQGLFSLNDCLTCPIGFICNQQAMNMAEVQLQKCQNGAYCPGGISTLAQTESCPIGHYCDNTAHIQPIPCPPGTQSVSLNQSQCQACDTGSYCPYKTSSPVEPPSGYFASQGGLKTPTPCPPGYYINTATDACEICPLGTFCDQYGVVSTTSARACPPGFYCYQTGILNFQALICEPGYYCPGGSLRIKCPAGSYCSGYGSSAVTGQCEAGYYCMEGAQVQNPTDNTQGNMCPTGSYCIAGVSSSTPCPMGTYNDKKGASNSSFCLQCPSNKVCSVLGLSEPLTSCPGGYYCITENNFLTQNLCPAGFKCPVDEQVKLRCPPGTYQNLTGISTCEQCPVGYYCFNLSNPITTAIDCPAGFYCPLGTSLPKSFPCEKGTYSTSTNLQSSVQCTPCPEGKYCDQLGQIQPTGSCRDGYVCNIGSQKATGDGTDSSLCPANFYCQAGVKTACLLGSFNSPRGARAIEHCVQCPPGRICTTANSSKECPVGFYCLGGLYLDSQAIPCPIGHYCSALSPPVLGQGLSSPMKCKPGTFQNVTGQIGCILCPNKFYCPTFGIIDPIPCTINMTCTEGSIIPRPCDAGKYADNDNMCQPCPLGKYCWPQNGTNGIKGKCEAGYVCQSGSDTPRPFLSTTSISSSSSNFLTYNGPALPGYYSTDGGNQYQCDVAFYQPSRWSTDCRGCYAGHFCPNLGMTSISNFQCDAGTFCAGSNTALNRSSCSEGLTTTRGQPHCMACEDGLFSRNSGVCSTCPSGNYCNNALLVEGKSVVQVCQNGRLCPGGNQVEPLCSDGNYLSNKRCNSCPTSEYCVGGVRADKCTAGYFCDSGASSPTPSDMQCRANYYCLHGANREIGCPTGYYRKDKGGQQITDCVACSPGLICERNTEPYECPKGFYCPVTDLEVSGSSKILPCPNGTYSQSTQLTAANQCTICPAGYLCTARNITDYTKYPCPAGMYCNARSLTPVKCPPGTFRQTTGGKMEGDCSLCTVGYYCPEGSLMPIRCFPGTYCPEGSSYFKTCTGGYFCNENTNFQEEICPSNYKCPYGSKDPIRCEGRHICREGTEVEKLCQAGSYVLVSEYGFLNECLYCPEGTYSTVQDLKCQNCTAGYLCYGRTNSKYPTNFYLNNGEICPKGHYCSEGSSKATPCPIGTYNSEFGAGSVTQCLLCPANTFSDLTGQSGCRACGAYASSIEGSSICECIGNFRSFSLADSSCRCKSGYDYINTITSQSEGQQSGDTDCTPLVYDRCLTQTQTRNIRGECVSLDDCSLSCNGGTGTRSETLGICTCDEVVNVDSVCNQNCRDQSTKMVYNSDGTVYLTVNGKNSTINLSQIGDVYGSLSCTGTNCSVKSAEMDTNGGFLGNYGTSALLEAKKRNLNGERSLATQIVDTRGIKNPVFCLEQGDSMMFTIQNPNHYPVYLKDSVMNSNPSFDYGQFLILSTQMKFKASVNNTKPSLFAFTFTDSGSYVFQDSSDQEQLMIIKVTEASEICTDPDRFIQPLTSDSVASVGVKINNNLIIKPDIPLLIGMGCILVLSIATVLVGISYCLHKGWEIAKARIQGYRSKYDKLDLDHLNNDLFVKDNDFEKFKSQMLDSDEDDLDNINLDIHQDLLEAGEDYLKLYNGKKTKRQQEKLKNKQEIVKLMKELEDMIAMIGSDAIANDMQIYDEKVNNGDGSQSDDQNEEQAEAMRQRELKHQQDKEREEEKKRQKLMQDWSDKDKQKLKDTKEQMKNDFEKIKKELQQDHGQRKTINRDKAKNSDQASEELALAIYEGGDPNARHNIIVRNIESNQNLSEEEKELMLQRHQQQMADIEDMLQADKKKSDQELELALKERIDKRKKQLELKNRKQIQKELAKQEQNIREEMEAKRQAMLDEQESIYQQNLNDSEGQAQSGLNYRQWVERLKQEREQAKLKIRQDIDTEINDRVAKEKEFIISKYTRDVDGEGDINKFIQESAPGMINAMEELKRQKQEQEQKLQEDIAQKKKMLQQKLKDEKDAYDKDLQNKNLIKEDELEKKKKELLKRQQIADGNNEDLDEKDRFHKLLEEIDNQTDLKELISNIGDQDSKLGKILSEQNDDQSTQLELRRQLLRERKLLKKNQEQEKERLDARIQQIKEEQDGKALIEQHHISSIFAAQKQIETESGSPQMSLDKQKLILNEMQSDAFLQKLSNMLMRHFLEKEARLKLILQKYTEYKILEKDNIKTQFKSQYDKLKNLKSKLSDDEFQQAMKKLRLQEENTLREVDLKFDQAMKEEEIKVRSEMDNTHFEESIALKKDEIDAYLKLQKDLNIIDKNDSKEEKKDRQNLDIYEETKRKELDRRQRNMQQQKMEIMRQIEKDLGNQYQDYDDLLSRKRQEEAVLQEQAVSIRKKLQDRRKKLREQGIQELSEQDQKHMLQRYQLQLEALESAFEEERRRQMLLMKKKQVQRSGQQEKQKNIKQLVEEQELDKIKDEIGSDNAGLFEDSNKVESAFNSKDSILARKLKDWKLRRQDHKHQEQEQKLAETVIELDPMSLKKLMVKLDSIEKHLRELRKHKKAGGGYEGKNTSHVRLLNTDSSQAKVSHRHQPTGLDSVPSPSPTRNLMLNGEGKFNTAAQTPQQDLRVHHPVDHFQQTTAKKIDYSKLQKFVKK